MTEKPTKPLPPHIAKQVSARLEKLIEERLGVSAEEVQAMGKKRKALLLAGFALLKGPEPLTWWVCRKGTLGEPPTRIVGLRVKLHEEGPFAKADLIELAPIITL